MSFPLAVPLVFPMARSLLPLTQATIDWANAVVANGGTVSDTRRSQVDALISSMQAAGTWQLTDDYWLLVAENSVQALTSLKQRRRATAVNSPTFTADRGYTTDGATNYIDTGFIPPSHAVQMSLNNTRISTYQRSNLTGALTAVGTNSASNRSIFIRPRSGSTMLAAANSGAGTFTLTVADGRGYFSVSRNGSNATDTLGFQRGVQLTRTVDPAGVGASLPSVSVFISAQNNSGVAGQFTAGIQGLVSVGAALTSSQELVEYNAIQAYMTALGAAV